MEDLGSLGQGHKWDKMPRTPKKKKKKRGKEPILGTDRESLLCQDHRMLVWGLRAVGFGAFPM